MVQITGHRYSYVVYTGDGSTTLYTVPFPFLDRAFVRVSVDGAASTFSWLSDSVVQLPSPPRFGSTIRIQRATEKARTLVDFADGSILNEEDLDTNAVQMLHMR